MMKTETKQNMDLRHTFMRSHCVPAAPSGLSQLVYLGLIWLTT